MKFRIRLRLKCSRRCRMDCRIKSGNDELRASNLIPAMRWHPSHCSSGTKVLPQTDGKLFSSSLEKQGRRSAERRTTVAAPGKRAQPRSFATARPSALLRGYTPGLFIPTRLGPRFLESPGQRGSPRRCQCSEHLTVRSRAGRVDAQTACRQRVTTSARRNRSRSVSPRHRRRPSRRAR